jgi:hypothetical protein
MSRKDGDRIRLLDGDSSSSHHGGTSAGGGPGVNRLGDLLGGAPLPPPAEIHVAIDKHQVGRIVSLQRPLPESRSTLSQSPAVVSMNEFMEDISTLKGTDHNHLFLSNRLIYLPPFYFPYQSITP